MATLSFVKFLLGVIYCSPRYLSVRDGGDSMLPAIFHGRVFTTVPSFDRFLLYVVDVQLRSDQNRTNQMGTWGWGVVEKGLGV